MRKLWDNAHGKRRMSALDEDDGHLTDVLLEQATEDIRDSRHLAEDVARLVRARARTTVAGARIARQMAAEYANTYQYARAYLADRLSMLLEEHET